MVASTRCLSPLLLAAAVIAAAGAACHEPGLEDRDVRPGQGGETSAPAGSGLPCDVARVLTDSCGACHGSPPAGGAQTSLLTREDLLLPAASDPSLTRADDALRRMQDPNAPMPPTGLLDTSATDPLAKWIADGMPDVGCGEELVPPDNPYDTPLVCTSNRWWDEGNEGDEEMHPGHACIACHLDPDAFGAGGDDDDDDDLPIFTIAGTVYPTAHEPNDCYGIDDIVRVEVTDADGVVAQLDANEAGNFFTELALRAPYRIRVLRGDVVRAMSEPAEHGDCNVCHTQDGAKKAPGRVMAP
ncbi:MAG: hypothetical protein JNL21_29315 [Myxococcales bacterium]|nr:hypothetical protein [Myxococcales bacterium]